MIKLLNFVKTTLDETITRYLRYKQTKKAGENELKINQYEEYVKKLTKKTKLEAQLDTDIDANKRLRLRSSKYTRKSL